MENDEFIVFKNNYNVEIKIGDCTSHIQAMSDNSVDCIVTSPPYWGLRDYGVDGQIGLEPTLDEYLDAMTGIFRECRRVLTPKGTFWLNIGDSYAANRTYQVPSTKGGKKHGPAQAVSGKGSTVPAGMKSKDLCMVPNRLAIKLQEDGWYVRSEIIWHKPNVMPESVTDRPTCAHEKVWLLTKSEKYFYDAPAIKEPCVSNHPSGNGFKRTARLSYADKDGARGNDKQWTGVGGTRNARNVWSISTKPFKGAHFATMAPELAEKCIKAGCPENGTVLDPFGGSGTTGFVANSLGRNAILIELNPAYAQIAADRCKVSLPQSGPEN